MGAVMAGRLLEFVMAVRDHRDMLSILDTHSCTSYVHALGTASHQPFL
jgi:hypothetical protein